MVQGVIFDLDGVLVSTDEMHYQAWKKLAQKQGIDAYSRQDNLRQRGVSRMESLEVVLEKSGKNFTQQQKEALAEEKNTMYVEMLDSLGPDDVLPGALQTVQLLKSKGVLVAVGSASKNTGRILERAGLAPLFDAVADGWDTTRSKPDPEVFLVAAQKLGLAPAVCLVVEDANAGIEAGTAAGMRTLGVGPAAQNPGATYRAQNLADGMLDWDRILRAKE